LQDFLLLPPVRRWLGAKVRVQSFSTATRQERRNDTVIDGEAVEIAGEVLPPTPHRRPDGSQP